MLHRYAGEGYARIGYSSDTYTENDRLVFTGFGSGEERRRKKKITYLRLQAIANLQLQLLCEEDAANT
ncbi:unnamed protein product [Prunus brigantina]